MGENEERKKPLPVGESFFDRVIEDGAYYVDKTLFIKALLDNGARVTLLTRPRRFGKTLNQTMLKCFFEDTAPLNGKDTRALFNGLKIEDAGDRYLGHQGKYPVIFLSFKEAKRATFEDSYIQLKNIIAKEFRRHEYALGKISSQSDGDLFKKLADGDGTVNDYSTSLLFLCECLENCHGQKAVVLIDEYDVPLENSWTRNFYDEMINFVRPLLSSALKDNPSLQLSVITGCLRISKESIFTGLNNLEVVSILSDSYSEHFGFTQGEMDTMLGYYGLESKTQILRDWYNGYLFGSAELYNPWSSVRVVGNWLININRYPEPFWANTCSNDIIRDMADKANAETKTHLETLIAGGTISAVVHENVTYGDIYKNADNLWNFLFFTGYLKNTGDGRQNADGELTLHLSIPNIELKYIYVTQIREWFNDRIAGKNLDALHNAVIAGDAETFQDELSALLAETISFMDSAENFYHGFMAGVLSRIKGFSMRSNRESGDGRSDLVLYRDNGKKSAAVIFELKIAKEFDKLPAASENALKQIEDKNYAAEWNKEGYNIIIKYGVGFYRKRCEIRVGG
jgi:hypothetical protein